VNIENLRGREVWEVGKASRTSNLPLNTSFSVSSAGRRVAVILFWPFRIRPVPNPPKSQSSDQNTDLICQFLRYSLPFGYVA
jgi:hypothetical protein